MLLSNGCCVHCWVILRYKGQNFFFVLFCSCLCRKAWFLSSKVTSERVVWIKFSGYPLSRRCVLKFVILSSSNVLEELVLSSLRASPLTKRLFTPDGWQVKKRVYWNVSVGLKRGVHLAPTQFLIFGHCSVQRVFPVSHTSAITLILHTTFIPSSCQIYLYTSS